MSDNPFEGLRRALLDATRHASRTKEALDEAVRIHAAAESAVSDAARDLRDAIRGAEAPCDGCGGVPHDVANDCPECGSIHSLYRPKGAMTGATRFRVAVRCRVCGHSAGTFG